MLWQPTRGILQPNQSWRRPQGVAAAGGAIAFVIGAAYRAGTSNGFTSASLDTTGANFIVIAFATAADPGDGVISDSKGNTWTFLTEYVGGFSDRWLRLYYAQNATTGTGHTFTCSGTSIFPAMIVGAFSGVATSSAFDVQNGPGSTNVGPPVTTGSITPSVDNELLIAGLQTDNTTSISIGSSFTIIATQSDTGSFGAVGASMAYLIQTTAAAANPQWNWSSGGVRCAANIASFKAA